MTYTDPETKRYWAIVVLPTNGPAYPLTPTATPVVVLKSSGFPYTISVLLAAPALLGLINRKLFPAEFVMSSNSVEA